MTSTRYASRRRPISHSGGHTLVGLCSAPDTRVLARNGDDALHSEPFRDNARNGWDWHHSQRRTRVVARLGERKIVGIASAGSRREYGAIRSTRATGCSPPTITRGFSVASNWCSRSGPVLFRFGEPWGVLASARRCMLAFPICFQTSTQKAGLGLSESPRHGDAEHEDLGSARIWELPSQVPGRLHAR